MPRKKNWGCESSGLVVPIPGCVVYCMLTLRKDAIILDIKGHKYII
jgi:hypothetical protein